MNHVHRETSKRRQRQRRFLILACSCMFLCAAAGSGCADELTRQGRQIVDEANAATFPIRMYQKFLSGTGDRCPMMPSCSRYGIEAFEKHGYLIGWIMTSDRLLRCGGDETRLSKTLRKNHETYSYDPLAANDFWWFHGP